MQNLFHYFVGARAFDARRDLKIIFRENVYMFLHEMMHMFHSSGDKRIETDGNMPHAEGKLLDISFMTMNIELKAKNWQLVMGEIKTLNPTYTFIVNYVLSFILMIELLRNIFVN